MALAPFGDALATQHRSFQPYIQPPEKRTPLVAFQDHIILELRWRAPLQVQTFVGHPLRVRRILQHFIDVSVHDLHDRSRCPGWEEQAVGEG